LYGDAGFEAQLVHADGEAVVRVRGEVDFAARPELDETFADALSASARVVVDLSETTFMDASGIAALVEAHKRAGQHGGAVIVRSPSAMTRRLLAITGVDGLVTIESER
jgi:anti-sigma B factor antagonist